MTLQPGNTPKLPPLGLLDQFCPFGPVDLCPELEARQCEQVFDFWEEWEKAMGSECPVPHWAIVWPAAALLARYLLDHPETVRGKTVAEIGCGGAVAAIAAMKCGAKQSLALDIDPLALYFAQGNAGANRTPITTHLSDSELFEGNAPAEVILFADFFYDASHSAMIEKIRNWKQTAVILIADGERSFTPGKFSEVLLTRRLNVNLELEGVSERTVRILRL